MSVSPSLSRGFSRPGVAVRFATDRWRSQMVLAGRSGTPNRFVSTTAWFTVESHTAARHVGLTMGASVDREPRESPLRVASLHGSFRGERLQCSGEMAMWLPPQPYVAVRFSHPGSSTWAARYIRAPGFSSSVNAAELEPNGSVEAGVACDAGARFGTGRWRAALFLGTNHAPGEHRRIRRATLGVSGNRHGLAWQAAIASIETIRARAASDPYVATDVGRDHEVRFHARLTGSSRGEFSHTIALDYRPGQPWRSEGLSLSVATEVAWRRLEAAWQLTAYAMAPGQSRLVTRPGVGTFEWVSWVYGTGSDVALRVRLRVTRDLALTGYYGQPWLKDERVYIGAQLAVR
jgi:hypothetical protein